MSSYNWPPQVGLGGTVTDVTASLPLNSTGGNSPNISIPQASAAQNGYLSLVDWSTFNNKQNALTLGNITDAGTDGISITGGTGAVIGSGVSLSQQKSDSVHNGYLSAADWTVFNNKLSPNFSNYITNSNAEVDTSGWNLYNNSGNPASAYVVVNDLTYTAATPGNAGNGINIDYVFVNSPPFSGPTVTVLSPTHVTIGWYNGPTLAQNPTAAQIKTAWDAVPGAVALATVAITGTGSNKQYITGSHLTANGGDAAPTTGSGGISSGVTFTRNTSTPLVGVASFDLAKIALSEQGQGVSTDFVINALDIGQILQISFAYKGSAAMVLGTGSDVQVFMYDITNAVLIPVTPLQTIAGPVNTAKTFTGVFQTSPTSASYRLILHIATANASAWDLLLDSVTVNNQITAGAATQVPSLVLKGQPISGAVTDHMCVMWKDGATQWIPATIAGVALPTFGDDQTQAGFATNIVGSTADIYVSGSMDGFSFGPFVGFTQYIDNTAGAISPLPSPFTDLWVQTGIAISSTVLNINFVRHVDLIANSSGVPLKGGLLSSSAINDGTGDLVLTVGGNGNVLVANSAASLGINWAPAVVAGTGLTYTTATRSLTLSNLAGDVTGAPQTNTIAAATVTGKALTGFVSGAGAVTAADTILTAFNKINGNVALKAPLATPTFTGDVNSSTGNILISTIGKGLQVKTGTNAKIGTAVLVGGTSTVANTSVTANSRIFVTSNTDGGTPGWLRVSAKTAATSFVITSSSATDTSTVAWIIVESIP